MGTARRNDRRSNRKIVGDGPHSVIRRQPARVSGALKRDANVSNTARVVAKQRTDKEPNRASGASERCSRLIALRSDLIGQRLLQARAENRRLQALAQQRGQEVGGRRLAGG